MTYHQYHSRYICFTLIYSTLSYFYKAIIYHIDYICWFLEIFKNDNFLMKIDIFKLFPYFSYNLQFVSCKRFYRLPHNCVQNYILGFKQCLFIFLSYFVLHTFKCN